LHKKKQERASSALAIDLHRPTFIKVNRKYLHPDTLDYYGLPWEWDSVSNLPFAFKQQANKQTWMRRSTAGSRGFAGKAFGLCVMLSIVLFFGETGG